MFLSAIVKPLNRTLEEVIRENLREHGWKLIIRERCSGGVAGYCSEESKTLVLSRSLEDGLNPSFVALHEYGHFMQAVEGISPTDSYYHYWDLIRGKKANPSRVDMVNVVKHEYDADLRAISLAEWSGISIRGWLKSANRRIISIKYLMQTGKEICLCATNKFAGKAHILRGWELIRKLNKEELAWLEKRNHCNH